MTMVGVPPLIETSTAYFGCSRFGANAGMTTTETPMVRLSRNGTPSFAPLLTSAAGRPRSKTDLSPVKISCVSRSGSLASAALAQATRNDDLTYDLDDG